MSLYQYNDASGGGKDLVNSATGASDGSGNWASEVYYYGTVEELLIGTAMRFVNGTLSTDVQTTYAQIDGYGPIEMMSDPAFPTSDSEIGDANTNHVRYAIPFAQFEKGGPTNIKIFGGVKASPDPAGASKIFKATPVELKVTSEYSGGDVNNKLFNIDKMLPAFDITVVGNAGTTGTLDTTKITVKSGDTAVPVTGSVVATWDKDTGKLNITPNQAQHGDQLVITVGAPEVPSDKWYKFGEGLIKDVNAPGGRPIPANRVAGVSDDTVFAQITVNFVDFDVEPAYASWLIGTSADAVVNFVAEVSGDDFARISDGTTNYIVSTDLGGDGSGSKNGVNVEMNGADKITVGITKAFFENAAAGFTPKEDGSIDEAKTLRIFANKGGDDEIGAITLLFKKPADPKPDPVPDPVPPTSDDPRPEDRPVTDLIKEQGNATYAEKITQELASGAKNSFLLTFQEDGKTIDAVNGIDDEDVEIIRELDENSRPLPMRMAFLKVGASGELEAADDRPENINIVIESLFAGDSTENFDVTDASGDRPLLETIAVSDDGSASFSVANKKIGGAPIGFYTIKVFEGAKIQAGSLAAKADGDLLATQKLMISGGSSPTGGGACDMGFGLAAAAGLAALAMRRRGI